MLFRQSADIIIKGPPQTGRLFVLGAASERDGRPLKKRKKKKGRLQSQYCDQVLYEVAVLTLIASRTKHTDALIREEGMEMAL